MKQNVGKADKVLRIAVALTIAVLLLIGVISGTITTALSVVAIMFIATSIMGSCPLYSVCKISTRKQQIEN